MLYKCKNIEAWGTGLKNTYSICQSQNIKVGYENEQDGFWFIFYRNNGGKEQRIINDRVQPYYENNGTLNINDVEVSESEQIVLQEINKDPKVTIKRLSELTKRGERTIQRTLNKLKDKNIIKRVDGKKGYWKIIR